MQTEVMESIEIQCCYLHGVSEDNHERSGQSVYREEAKMQTTNTYPTITASYYLEQ
jgi:hypothetical protein